ncbi:energy-coupling factor transporter transmembrane component T family protein [Rhizobium sp. SL86]|jgi:biotin transport system permease protein|uniref:energy-coupling factor transporter transmembrane component T family protein n=1 Tax=Rhizobium sp. SL86 TaxID=2995148 RepID=UPI002273DFC6|nr:energy-coupling factor transporter transmembrane protein EcfT [Rhizobium sp. SL86]MCY1664434.1 energy-coupling factor transporter transmembrane protein EcfT [Rhizobium sp. SL86]
MLNSLHVEGRTLLHRLPAGPKLALLAAVSLALFFVQSLPILALSLAVTGLLYGSLGLSAGEALKRIRPVLITILLFALVNLVLISATEALTTTLRLLSVLLLAASVTATTTIAAFMDVLTKLFLPLERLGLLKAADISLAVGLVLRFVPEIAARYEGLKEAHRARGLPVRLSRILGPLIISTLKDADSIAQAIDARGIRGQ